MIWTHAAYYAEGFAFPSVIEKSIQAVENPVSTENCGQVFGGAKSVVLSTVTWIGYVEKYSKYTLSSSWEIMYYLL